MTSEWIDFLSILVLLLFLVALVYLIVLLHRANRIVGRLDNLGETFRSFTAELIPTIINVGTIANAIHRILKVLTDHQLKLDQGRRSKRNAKTKK